MLTHLPSLKTRGTHKPLDAAVAQSRVSGGKRSSRCSQVDTTVVTGPSNVSSLCMKECQDVQAFSRSHPAVRTNRPLATGVDRTVTTRHPVWSVTPSSETEARVRYHHLGVSVWGPRKALVPAEHLAHRETGSV